MRNAMKISKNTVLNCRVLLGLGRVTGSGAWISVMLSKPKISSNGSSVFRKNFDTVPYSDAKSLFSLLSWKSMGRVAGQAHEVNDVEGLSDSIKKPQLPLCLRQPLHYESLKSLLDWKIEACRHATAESSSWESLRDMPTQEDLETELAWLLDDSVAAIKLVPHGEWKQTSWRELERGMQFLNVEVAEVQLREPLGKLGEYKDCMPMCSVLFRDS